MVQKVKCHGGPLQGKTEVIPDDRDHFHIIQPVGKPQDIADHPEVQVVPTREGTYSRVHGSTEDFEWDGWRSHD